MEAKPIISTSFQVLQFFAIKRRKKAFALDLEQKSWTTTSLEEYASVIFLKALEQTKEILTHLKIIKFKTAKLLD